MDEFIVKQKREFGELIADPFKLIFRNLKDIAIFLSVYVILPFIIAMVSVSIFQVNIMDIDNQQFGITNIIMIAVMIIALFISYLHAGLSAFSIIQVAEQDGFENIKYNALIKEFKSYYVRNLIFVFTISLVLGVSFGLVVFLIIGAPVAGVIFMVLFFAFMFFYVLPVTVMSWASYLSKENKLSLPEALTQGANYVNEYYGGVLGIIIVSSIITSILQYSFAIPLTLVNLLFSTSVSMDFGSNRFNTFLIIQNGLVAAALAFLIVYTGIVHLFKYYDIRERKYGFSMLEKIKMIGKKEESYFVNEGDY